MHPAPGTLSLAISLAIASAATITTPALTHASPAPADTELRLPAVTVSALGMSEEEGQITAPFSIIDGEDILRRDGNTLGDVLDGLPGVHSDTFGGGASRPVIRGQSAPRVKVLSDGAALLDASDISPDHAITTDALLLRRVEVLRGPATLLYGSGAVGGVVNLLDDKIPSIQPEDGFDGMLTIRGNTVANERAGAAAMTSTLESHLALHAEFSTRQTDDYRAPRREGQRVSGTFAESTHASAGLSWIGDNGYIGLAYSHRDDDYGLPGHSHTYEQCHPHGGEIHCGGHDDHGHVHDDDDAHEHEAPPSIDLKSTRFDMRGEFYAPFAGIERVRFRASHTDYRHHELDEGDIASRFTHEGHEERVEMQHVPLGNWTGIFGLQHSDARFGVQGSEAFLPTVDTRSTGIFVVEHLDAGERWHFELGARHEWLRHQPRDDPRARPTFNGSATSLSAAAIWNFAPDTSLSISATRSERLPHAQELYARGVHLATNTYECGLLAHPFTCGGTTNDAEMAMETSRNVELNLRRDAGPFTFSIGAFFNDVDNYIHARTLDQHEAFRLVKYTQRDADFSGFEAEAGYRFSENLDATVFADRVRGEFVDDGPLPRIPASRLGVRVKGSKGRLDGEVEYYGVASQERIAAFETRTPSYNMLNLSLSYAFGAERQTRVFLRGSNLLNQDIRNHASFLANVIPLPGRNLSAGLSYHF